MTEPPPNVTITNEQLQTLLQGFGRMISEQAVRPETLPTVVMPTPGGNFSRCQSRFSGEKGEDVEAFINAISVYKECLQISDDNALKGLPMLLDRLGATWYQGAKGTLNTWQNAIDNLKHVFGRKLPPHRVYRSLFGREQGLEEPTDIFVSNCRALLAQLPETPKLPEEHKLHMVYGLLNRRIRERLAREDITDFITLLDKARGIEAAYMEVQTPTTEKPQKARPKCHYCHSFGHTMDECRKRRAKTEDTSKPPTSSLTAPKETPRAGELTCYACHRPGHVRSQCPSRAKVGENAAQNVSVLNAEVLMADVSANMMTPFVRVTIEGLTGLAQIDTGAKCSIAGWKLFQHLRSNGCPSVKQRLQIAMADGIQREVDAVRIETTLHIKDKEVPMTFIAIPQFEHNKSLLGLDFIRTAGIVLDIPNGQWSFVHSPTIQYTFERIPEGATPTLNSLNVSLRSEEGVNLSSREREQMDDLLGRNQDVFEKKTTPTPFAEHRIKLTTDEPISVPPHRMSPHRREILQTELDSMIRDDVIEECESPYAAPVVLVPKKDNQFRVCVDYRELNKVTVPDRYPLPRIDDLLHAAKPTSYMSTIDLKAGYWQVPVNEADRDKTAFVTPFGLFRFKRMPFGLTTAPATFQRMIDRFKSGLSHILLLAYLDDLIVISATFDEHLRDLQQVFTRLRYFQLCANRDKCMFGCASVRYLGHLITPDGIAPDRAKISAILDRPRPTNVKQLQSFLQTCNWFRRFINDYAHITRPLCDLTKKKVLFAWEPVHQQAYDNLKEKLTTAPLLRQADPSIPYVLKTDASAYAIGGCLLQGEAEDERPIEYVSRLLKPAERNYSTTEREALALVYSVEKFRGYIEGTTVRVGSDHRPLKWLWSLRNVSGRLARWITSTQQFDLRVEYIPGRTNVVADMLSRPGGDGDSATELNYIEAYLPRESAKKTREKQVQDPDVLKIIRCLEDETAEPGKFQICWTNRGYCMNDGVLYRYTPDIDTAEPQLVIPKSMVNEILQENHDAPTAGHYGVEKTCWKIAQRYFWPTLHRDVTRHVKSCVACQRYKVRNVKPAGLVQTSPLARRFEVLAIDLFGPLPETPTGERWVLAIEDTATRWMELFALKTASALACAQVLIDEVILRYGCPRKITSDNGVQFVSDLMQQVAYIFGINQSFTPLYHPEANPEERRNRELKTQLAILVKNNHRLWKESLPAVRFAMNSTRHSTLGFSPAYLSFGREMRSPADAHRDLREIIEGENLVTELTPYLKTIDSSLRQARETHEFESRRAKENADKRRTDSPSYSPGDKVLLKTHILSDASKGVTSKFAPRRDGPYQIQEQVTPTTYMVATMEDPPKLLGKYHSTALVRFMERDDVPDPSPVVPQRTRGRPRRLPQSGGDPDDPNDSDDDVPVDPCPIVEAQTEEVRTTRTRRAKTCTAPCCAP